MCLFIELVISDTIRPESALRTHFERLVKSVNEHLQYTLRPMVIAKPAKSQQFLINNIFKILVLQK
jgi:hypothetical protein